MGEISIEKLRRPYAWARVNEAQLAALLDAVEALREVPACPVVIDVGKYREVQVDDVTWRHAEKALARLVWEDKP